jgi:hypothetical protein
MFKYDDVDLSPLPPVGRIARILAVGLAGFVALAMLTMLRTDVACHSGWASAHTCDLGYHDPTAYPLGENNPMTNGQ